MMRDACRIGWLICLTLGTLCLMATHQTWAVLDMENAVAIWLFDEGEGQVAHDSSPNANHAEFQGDPRWVKGKFGQALWFNGSTDYVAVPDSESLDINGDQLSIVAWIQGEGWPAANHVVRKVADAGTASVYILRVQPDTVRVYLNTEAGETVFNGTTVLPTNEWIHTALVYDGKEARIYVNGQLDGSTAVTGEIVQSDNELRIGRGEPAGYFMGSIDEVGILATPLSEEDIQQIMDGGLAPILAAEPRGKLPTVWARIRTY